MINKNIDAVTSNDIEALITNQSAESRTLEYKEKLPGNSDDDKKEFLKDVSAFANTSGGDIIYGISEKRDSDGKTTGFPDQAKGLSSINADAEKRRLDSILQDGLDPRIPGVRIETIDGFNDGSIIIIRVPKSWNSPHMVVFKRWSRFFARNSAAVYQLDVAEIRSTFIASDSLAERIRQFRSDRIAKIIADETLVALTQSPKIVLHVLPLVSFSSGTLIDVSKIQETSVKLIPINSSIWDTRYNFDGLCSYSPSQKSQVAYSYAQVFRNGCIEAANAFLLKQRESQRKNIIPSVGYERELIAALKNYLELQKILQLNPPTLVMLNLLGVKGYRMSSEQTFEQGQSIDRDYLLIPEIFVESYDVKPSVVLRPAFDAVWQACGYLRSLNYDEDGKWRERES